MSAIQDKIVLEGRHKQNCHGKPRRERRIQTGKNLAQTLGKLSFDHGIAQ